VSCQEIKENSSEKDINSKISIFDEQPLLNELETGLLLEPLKRRENAKVRVAHASGYYPFRSPLDAFS